MQKLPAIVVKLTQVHGGWIVGSSADPSCDLANVRDIDILIPFEKWEEACQLIPSNASPNTFSGWKFKVDDTEIDVWPGSLSEFLVKYKGLYAWHPQSSVRIKKFFDKWR